MSLNIRRRICSDDHQLPAHLHPLLRRILASRKVLCAEDMALDLRLLHPPQLLKGIVEAVDLLEAHLHRQGRLLFVADFDADGATSCAVGVRALRWLGFHNVDYMVPNRAEHGYGLTPEIVALAQQRSPDLIITVDNGISSLDGVEAARAAGIEVLITDHHLPGAELPRANAIVNPNQPGCSFPCKALAGVGVIFYLMLALRARLREKNRFTATGISEPNLAQLLDLVALGTVADVVALDRNNRILVNEGLKRIRSGRACPGILALLEIGGRDYRSVVASDLGFAVGPRLNAAGRLDDMMLGIECLLTEDAGEASRIATRLNETNEERKRIEAQMLSQAAELLQTVDLSGQEMPAGLCLYDGQWHQGVIGILASRLKDQLHRPVVAFADASSGAAQAPGVDEAEQELRGSARSIAGLHIRDVLERIATRQPGLLLRFGGHAMAAGLSLRKGDYQRFATAFAQEVGQQLDEDALRAVIVSDGEIDAADMNMDTASLLREVSPWGQNFPEPVFDGIFRVVQQRLVGGRHLKLVVSPVQGSALFDAIAFNVLDGGWPKQEVQQLHLVYRLDINEYRGRRSVQLLVENLAEVGS